MVTSQAYSRRRPAGFQEDWVPRRRAGLLLVIAAVAAVLFLFTVLSWFLADWWWFKEIGYQVVFTRELVERFFSWRRGA